MTPAVIMTMWYSRPATTCPPRLANVEVALSSDLGVNDTRYLATTHLGHLVKAGDVVLGYLLAKASLNSAHAEELERGRAGLPDVVLVRKIYDKKKSYKLKSEDRGGGLSDGGSESVVDGRVETTTD